MRTALAAAGAQLLDLELAYQQEAAGIAVEQRDEHYYDWRNVGGCTDPACRRHARAKQLAPADAWSVWLILTGRGWGKTRSSAEWVREQVEQHGKRRIALIADTAADVRDVMIEGESGILDVSPPWNRPLYEPSKRRLTWPNGAIATTYSAEDPDQLRGPQHDAAWGDEPAKWRRCKETLDNLFFGLRLGDDPRCMLSTTPRPTSEIKNLVKRDGDDVHVTRGHTYENIENLAPPFRKQVVERYEGTRIGRQELAGEVLEDVEGALWHQSWIDDARLRETDMHMARIVVAIDPAVTHGEDADQTGIAVVGLGDDGEWYVLDAAGYRLSPHGWAQRAIDLYDTHSADRIIAERNNGGEMVEETIRRVRHNVPVKTIAASRGKTVRAEPVAALYEQGRVHHIGMLTALEEQMCVFPVAAEHDDLVDAVVYAITELMNAGSIEVL